MSTGSGRVPVRQWVLSFPIPLRVLFAAYPEVLTPVLRVIHRVIAGSLLKQAGLKRATADTGALTLIQRFGSAANLNIHLHCLVLDGVYRRTEDDPVFQQARAPTRDELQGLLEKTIARLLKRLTRLGYLVEEQGMTCLADIVPDGPLTPLQAASWPCGPRRTSSRDGDTVAHQEKGGLKFLYAERCGLRRAHDHPALQGRCRLGRLFREAVQHRDRAPERQGVDGGVRGR